MADDDRLVVVLAHLDGFVRVKLRGDLDYDMTIRHAAELREVTDIRTRVVLDLGEVQFVDSSGLRFLVNLARGHDGPVRLENVPPRIHTVLTVAGLGGVFDIGTE